MQSSMALLHVQSGQSPMTKSRVVYGADNFLDKPKADKELCNLERIGIMLEKIMFPIGTSKLSHIVRSFR